MDEGDLALKEKKKQEEAALKAAREKGACVSRLAD
jgi:Translation machinery associated TMA7